MNSFLNLLSLPMLINRITLVTVSLASLITADVRTCTAPGTYAPPDDKSYKACDVANNVPGFKIPHTFGYKGIENQRKNNFDEYMRSNLENEQNKRDEEREPAQD